MYVVPDKQGIEGVLVTNKQFIFNWLNTGASVVGSWSLSIRKAELCAEHICSRLPLP